MAYDGLLPDLLVAQGVNSAVGNVGGNAAFNPDWWQKFTGYFDPNTRMQTMGIGPAALGIGQSLMSGYLGLQQLNLAKDSLAQGKDQFNRQFGAQQKLTNTALYDKFNSRYMANPNAYERPEVAMKKWGV